MAKCCIKFSEYNFLIILFLRNSFSNRVESYSHLAQTVEDEVIQGARQHQQPTARVRLMDSDEADVKRPIKSKRGSYMRCSCLIFEKKEVPLFSQQSFSECLMTYMGFNKWLDDDVQCPILGSLLLTWQ